MGKRTFKQHMLIDAPLLLYFGMSKSGYHFVQWKSLLPLGIQQKVLFGGIWTVLAIAVYYTCLFIHFYHKKDDPPTSTNICAEPGSSSFQEGKPQPLNWMPKYNRTGAMTSIFCLSVRLSIRTSFAPFFPGRMIRRSFVHALLKAPQQRDYFRVLMMCIAFFVFFFYITIFRIKLQGSFLVFTICSSAGKQG